MKVSLIAAASENSVIGKKGSLPWHIPKDLKRFKEITTGHHIIMGRKTFESMKRPLLNRVSIILTRQKDFSVSGFPECMVVHSLEEALEKCQRLDEVFIIGGEKVFEYALEKKLVDKIYLTRIHNKYSGDAFFPPINEKNYKVTHKEKHAEFSFINYELL